VNRHQSPGSPARGFALISAALIGAFAITFVSGGGPSGGGYDLSWNTFDGGGGTSTGGSFSLTGTIGQHDAGPSGGMTGGTYSLTGGFWPGASAASSAPCPADFDASGGVNGLDLAQLLGQWSGAATYAPCPPPKPQDLNGDCKVNGLDLALLLGAWGACP
jgi:hypothetical protein